MQFKGYYNKLINKYKSLSDPVKASLWFTICSILQKGISMITVPIFTRILTTQQYGVYSIYQSWYTIITIFATFNLSYGVFNNGMIKYESDKNRFTSCLQGLSTLITIILFVIYISAINFWNSIFELSTIFVMAMFVELLFSPAYSFWAAQQRFKYKYKGLVIITLIITLVSPILGVITVLSTEYKAEARVLSFVFVQICVGLIFYIYNIFKGKAIFDKNYWKFALRFNIPLIPHYLSQSILQQADRIMIGHMVGTDKVAIYSVAYNISMLMTLVTNAINNSFIPYTYKALKDKNYKIIEKSANVLLIIVGGAVTLVMALGPEIISVFASAEYKEAVWIIPPVAMSVYFMFLFPLFSNIEFYFEENKFIMMASVSGAILNIVLNWIFISIFGYIAAGYTTLVCYIIFAMAHYLFMNKVVSKHIIGRRIYNIKCIFIISILYLLVMCLMLFTYINMVLRYTVIGILLIVIIIKRDFIINQFSAVKK